MNGIHIFGPSLKLVLDYLIKIELTGIYGPRQNLQEISQAIYSEYDMKHCNNDLQLYMLSLIKSKKDN